ncbi:unnamed protein product [Owenia fusiformis]|uniref:Uncharacterized protein n=1 Tax=Owenia fusiformis TaxID=6347 RepID=A0A8S4P8I6_OWEFU|nr:unnamed protein product [Owenia fusiformis]
MVTTIEVPDKNINFTQKYYDDETYQIPGATFDLGVGTADTFVDVTLEKSDDGKFITMGLLLKVRVKVPILPAQWPDELKRDVFPPTTIPIPPCKGKKAQTPPPRHNCVPPKEHSGVHPSSPTTSRPPVKPPTGRPHKPVTTKPHTQQPPVIDVKGKKCTSSVDSGIIGQCGDNGKCSNGICGCMDGYAFNAITHSCTAQVNKLLGAGCELSLPECGYNAICKRKSQSSHSRGGVCACDVSNHFIKTSVNGGSACVPGDATETTKAPAGIPVTPQGKVDHGKDASDTPSTSNTVAIAASVGSIGFVLLVAGLVGAAIFIRRRRLRYRDHDVLLTTGDEGDDEPI